MRSPLNSLVLLVVLVSLCFAENLDVFVATTGDDSNSCTSSEEPCMTLQGAFSKIGNNTYDGTSVTFSEGKYSGDKNIGVMFPVNVSVSIVSDGAETQVTFDCADTSLTAFEVSGDVNSVSFGSLYVANCSTGIHFAPNAAGFGLTVDGTDFHQIEHPLSFRGSYLTVSQCSFNATTHGVEVSTATNVTIEQSFF